MKDKVTIQTLKHLKQIGQKICMVTAYDATFARILDDAGAARCVFLGDDAPNDALDRVSHVCLPLPLIGRSVSCFPAAHKQTRGRTP